MIELLISALANSLLVVWGYQNVKERNAQI